MKKGGFCVFSAVLTMNLDLPFMSAEPPPMGAGLPFMGAGFNCISHTTRTECRGVRR